MILFDVPYVVKVKMYSQLSPFLFMSFTLHTSTLFVTTQHQCRPAVLAHNKRTYTETRVPRVQYNKA